MKHYKVVMFLGITMLVGMTSLLETPYSLHIWTCDALAIRMEGGLIPKAEMPVLSREALKGSPEAAHVLMWEYRYQLMRDQKAAYWEEIGAENGDLLAQYYLGYHMNFGLCGDRNRDRGRFWLVKAADCGDSAAAKLLQEIGPAPIVEDDPTEMILPSNGQDFLSDKELTRLKTKALAGSPKPAFRLYLFYEYVHRDAEESRYWLRIAAQNDDPVGQFEFGLLLAKDSDERNQQRSRFWIERAARNGNPGAVEYLKNFPGE
ncbi:MAG: tetratricopeptide repeat protein [Syntrophobacteraceae bacterium]